MKFNFSKLKFKVAKSVKLRQSLGHARSLFCEKPKEEFNFLKLKFKVAKSFKLRQSLGHARSLFCREAKRGIQLFEVEIQSGQAKRGI